MAEAQATNAKRILTSVLAPAEKRALVWMARRLPGWVNSDHLTLLGLVALIACCGSYWLARWYPAGLLLVVPLLVINWFGDSLDGTVARVRNTQRPRYGFYVDHVIDAVGTVLLVGGMGLSGYMSPMVAASLLVAYFLLSIEVYLATCCRATFKISYWGVGPTELRILIAVGNVAAFSHPFVTLFGRQHLLFDVGGVVAIAGLIVTFAISAGRNTMALYREEPLPPALASGNRPAA